LTTTALYKSAYLPYLLWHVDDRPHRLSPRRDDRSAQLGRSVIYDCLVSSVFDSVRQIKLTVRQLLGERKHIASHRVWKRLLQLATRIKGLSADSSRGRRRNSEINAISDKNPIHLILA